MRKRERVKCRGGSCKGEGDGQTQTDRIRFTDRHADRKTDRQTE